MGLGTDEVRVESGFADLLSERELKYRRQKNKLNTDFWRNYQLKKLIRGWCLACNQEKSYRGTCRADMIAICDTPQLGGVSGSFIFRIYKRPAISLPSSVDIIYSMSETTSWELEEKYYSCPECGVDMEPDTEKKVYHHAYCPLELCPICKDKVISQCPHKNAHRSYRNSTHKERKEAQKEV